MAVGLVSGLALLSCAAWYVRDELAVSSTVSGLDDGAVISNDTSAGAIVRVATSPSGRVGSVRLHLDGRAVTDQAHREGDELVWPLPADLADGPHHLAVAVHRRGPLGTSTRSLSFSVDRQPPTVEVTAPTAVSIDAPVTVTGRTEAGASVAVGGVSVPAGADGSFSLMLPRPPAGRVEVVTTDAAGNRTVTPLSVPVVYPRSVGIHVTGAAWSYEPLRDGVLELVDQGRVNAVELDLKDEAGIVNYDTRVQLAHAAGAVEPYFDLRSTIDELHARGVRVIGRIVAYRDPPMADYAWEQGHRDWVMQNPDGTMLDAYGGFTNPANAEVRRYNVDLATEAADAGVDDILWDYIRRPEGDLAEIILPGQQGRVEDAVVALLAEAQPILRERGVFQGASVFGVAASRPGDVAQELPAMAPYLDYVAPMVYPSHWSAGEYDVEDPDSQPYDIVKASLADFERVLAGTGVAIVPWLQDFSLGDDYGADEVRAQIDGARDVGLHSFLLWDPDVTYTVDALDRP